MDKLGGVERSYEYELVHRFYADKKTARSKVYKIFHVIEGVFILNQLKVSAAAKRAFCIHPMLQDDADLQRNFGDIVVDCDRIAVALAMEYRNIANAYLSYRDIDSIEEIALSPIDAVNRMLIADKVQNRKDFELYLRGKIKNSDRLDAYFKNWLDRLGVSEEQYQEYVRLIRETFPEHENANVKF